MSLHTVLGANGAIARELSRALASFPVTLRQVSRSPRRVNPGDQTLVCDLLDPAATAAAVAGSDMAYLVVGLPYRAATWVSEWPTVMGNVIEACRRHAVPLVFFDNVYAYGRVEGPMTEATPFNPVSRKGEVRARVATRLLEEMHRGNLRAMIVRSADFYGPGASHSLVDVLVFQRLKAGRVPQWLGDPSAVHTFTFTPDAGRAMATLAHDPSAFGQTWHLPTSKEPITGRDFARLACEVSGRPVALQVVPRWLRRGLGLFVEAVRENEEMMYQFDADYRFDSSRIEAAYGLHATPCRRGIAETLAC